MNMFVAPQSTDLLLSEAEKESLYLKLIEQINKDFNLANEGIDFPMSIFPSELKIQLHEMLSFTEIKPSIAALVVRVLLQGWLNGMQKEN